MDYVALNAELQNDPVSVGYAAPLAAGELGKVADLLNAPRETVTRASVDGSVILTAIDPAEFAALTVQQLTRLMVILSAGESVRVGNAAVRTMLNEIFPPGGATRSAFAAAVQGLASRAEIVVGQAVTFNDVARALGRG